MTVNINAYKEMLNQPWGKNHVPFDFCTTKPHQR